MKNLKQFSTQISGPVLALLLAFSTLTASFSALAQVPRIDSVNPNAAHLGTPITINGANFDPTPSQNIVYFGGVRALVTSASANSLTAIVPAGATYAPISVTVAGLTAYANVQFVVTFNSSGVIDASSFASGINFPSEPESPAIDQGLEGLSAAIALADIDGDGRPDVVVANHTSKSISVFRNTTAVSGNITFAPKVDFSTPGDLDGPSSIAIADIDGDGKLDVVLGDPSSGTILIFRNSSSPGGVAFDLSGPARFGGGCRFGAGANSIALGDLDGDGKTDIVSVNNCGSVDILRNTSTVGSINSGSFAQPISVSVSTGVPLEGVAIADIDRDGKPDLLTAPASAAGLALLINASTSGNIAFGLLPTDPNSGIPGGGFGPLSGPSFFALADLNGDGSQDVLDAISFWDGNLLPGLGNVSVFPSTPSGGGVLANLGQVWMQRIAFADLDGDGLPDVIASGEYAPADLSVLQNLGDFNFALVGLGATIRRDPLTGNPNGVATAGDLDGDGQPDLVIGYLSGGVISVARNRVVPCTAPALVSASSEQGSTIVVSFDKPITLDSSQNKANYAVNGGAVAINAAMLNPDGQSVVLAVSGLSSAPNTVFAVTASGIQSTCKGELFTGGGGASDVVSPGCTAPVLLAATAPDGQTIRLSFNQALEPQSAQNPQNYLVNNGAVIVSGAILNGDGQYVTLAVAGLSAVPGTAFSVTASRIGDICSQQPILGGGTASGVTQPSLQIVNSFQIVKSFGSDGDGSYPVSGLIQGRDGTLYGATEHGGSGGVGTVFSMFADGTDYRLLHSFSGADGVSPDSTLVLGIDGDLYGTTYFGGSGNGVVYKLNRDGSGFTVLQSFNGADGQNMFNCMIQGTDGVLYGVTQYGGSSGVGVIFRLNRDGTGYSILKNLDGSSGYNSSTIFQGADGLLYGTTQFGGSGGARPNGGTVFKLNRDGSGFMVLKNFSGPDGANGGMLMQGRDGNLYGTTPLGGSTGGGTVFRLRTDGSGFVILKDFSCGCEGVYPDTLLQTADGTIFGTALGGGSFSPSGYGTIFKLNPDGSEFSVVKDFLDSSHFGSLLQGTDGALYGSMKDGGAYGAGAIFRLVVPQSPTLVSISPASASAGGAGFSLAVNGSQFQAGAAVFWNGQQRNTTFVSSTEISADILASDLLSSVDIATATVTVLNPGANPSSPLLFTITGPNVGVFQSASVAPSQSANVSTPSLTTPLTQAGQAAFAATVNNAGAPDPITVTAATFITAPVNGSIIDVGGGYVDLKISGADAGDSATVNFYYPTTLTGSAEAGVTLLYFTGSAWTPVRSSGGVAPNKNTANGLDGTTSGGRFTVLFDNTSTPKITELSGTMFGIAIATPALPNIQCPGSIVTNTVAGRYYGIVNYLSQVSSSDSDATVICGVPEAILTNCVFATEVFPGNQAAFVFAKGRTVVTCGATKPTLGTITTVAGNGTAAFGGDNGPAAAAKLNGPVAIASDSAGNIFIADYANNRIRRWEAATGTITTVAGNGTAGFSGDGGPATSASLNGPNSVAVDSQGNVYIADYLNLRVRKVAASSGIISTLTGTGAFGFTGDGGPAANAMMGHPAGLAVDQTGNLFVSNGEGANSRIRKVDALGIITTVAGSGPQGFSGDGGPAIGAQLNDPEGLAVDGSGNLFIADVGNERIRRVDAITGVITSAAGIGVHGFGGDGGPATAASLARAVGVRVDASGNLFIADTYNGMIRRVDIASGIISTVAGAGGTFATAAGNSSKGHLGFSGDGGSPMDAEFNSPSDLAFNGSGNLFIADAGNQRIRRVDIPMPVTASCSFVVDIQDTEKPTVVCPANVVTATVPGQCSAMVTYPAALVRDNAPNAIVAYSPPPGSVFPVGTSVVTCSAMDAAGGVVTTVVGNGVQGFSGDGGLAQNAAISLLYNPLAVDSAGNIFFGDVGNHRVRRVDAVTGVITTIAGNGTSTLSGLGGPATAAGLPVTTPLALDAAGNLFIGSGKQILRLDAAAGTIALFAGTGDIRALGDGGPAINASIGAVAALAVDVGGNLLILDSFNGLVRKVGAATGKISTVAGNGTRGFSGDGGPATSASMNDPEGMAVDRFGNIFINDNSNQRIRRVDAITGLIQTVAGITPAPLNACVVTDIPATNAWLHLFNGNPAVDSAGNLFFNANGGSLVRRVDAVSGIVSTIAGMDSTGFNGDGAPADTVQFRADGGVALDNHGDLLVVDRLNFRLRRISFAGAAMGNTNSCSFTITVQATPGLATLSPASALAGGPSFTLIVNGTCFETGAVVRWNGAAQATAFVSSSQLQATIPATNLASTPDLATVVITVLNGNGLASNPQIFTITSPSVGVVQSAIVPSDQAVTVSSPNISTPLTQPGQTAVSATVSNAGSPQAITVSAATFTNNPTTSKIIDAGGGYVDLKVTGADANDTTTANFYYPSTVQGTAEDTVVLLYYTGTIWAPVISSGGVPPVKNTANDLDGTHSGGRFTTTFDNTSTPKITELTGTAFTVTVPDTTPPVIHCPANIVGNTEPGQCSAAVSYVVTATDDSGAAKIACNPPSGSRFPKGTTSVTCTAADGSGNQASCSFTVAITDSEPPVVACPANIITSTDSGQCSTVVSYAPPVATDNCPGVTVTCNPASGSTFPKGATTVACTANASGNTNSCSFTVTVNDTEAPTIHCPANIVQSTAPGQSNAVVSFSAPPADNCPGVTASCTPASGSTFAKGTTSVTCQATDASGNTTSCSFTVTINDMEVPKITCPANQVVVATNGCAGSVVFVTATATDNCPGVTVSCTPASGSVLGPGTRTVQCTATDTSGNRSTCSFSLTVLAPLRVIFLSPLMDDNIENNFTADCADAPGTTEIANKFTAGQTLPHKVSLLDCNGNDVTDTVGSLVKVHLDVTERMGSYQSSVIINDVAETYNGAGDPGSLMQLVGYQFQYNLSTKGYEAGTINSPTKFFRSAVRVEYLSAPGIIVGQEDVILESK